MNLSLPHVVMLLAGAVFMYSGINDVDPRVVVAAAIKGQKPAQYLDSDAGKKLGSIWAGGLLKGAKEAGKIPSGPKGSDPQQSKPISQPGVPVVSV